MEIGAMVPQIMRWLFSNDCIFIKGISDFHGMVGFPTWGSKRVNALSQSLSINAKTERVTGKRL